MGCLYIVSSNMLTCLIPITIAYITSQHQNAKRQRKDDQIRTMDSCASRRGLRCVKLISADMKVHVEDQESYLKKFKPFHGMKSSTALIFSEDQNHARESGVINPERRETTQIQTTNAASPNNGFIMSKRK
jgi:hypothetical protein